MEKDLEAILNLFDDTGDDQEFVKEYLREAGYKPEELLEEAKQLISRKETELKIKKGELLQKKFEKELAETSDNSDVEKSIGSYALAAKKMENFTGGDEKIIKENEEILKRMKQGE